MSATKKPETAESGGSARTKKPIKKQTNKQTSKQVEFIDGFTWNLSDPTIREVYDEIYKGSSGRRARMIQLMVLGMKAEQAGLRVKSDGCLALETTLTAAVLQQAIHGAPSAPRAGEPVTAPPLADLSLPLEPRGAPPRQDKAAASPKSRAAVATKPGPEPKTVDRKPRRIGAISGFKA